jgi:hypothetical protein
MMRLRGMLAVALLGLLTGGFVRGEPAPRHRALDQAAEIRAHLQADPDLKNKRIDLTVADGIAILTGTVDTESEKMNAGELAMVRGIVGVQNQLDVATVGVK